jgi:hypothetical protein
MGPNGHPRSKWQHVCSRTRLQLTNMPAPGVLFPAERLGSDLLWRAWVTDAGLHARFRRYILNECNLSRATTWTYEQGLRRLPPSPRQSYGAPRGLVGAAASPSGPGAVRRAESSLFFLVLR